MKSAIFSLFSPNLYPANRASEHFFILDGARGIAALIVLVYHYLAFLMPNAIHGEPFAEPPPLQFLLSPLYDYGLYAVQFFWIISGFIFASVYYGSTISSRTFSINRFARLYPLHILTLCVVALLQAWWHAKTGRYILTPDNDLTYFILHIFFASNWLSSEGTFNGPIWSVSAEVLIYAVFWLTRDFTTKHGIVYPIAFAFVCLILKVILLPTNPVLSCGYYFFIGVALSGVREACKDTPKLVWTALVAASFVGLAAFATGIPQAHRVVGIPFLFGSIVLALVLLENRAPQYLRRAASSIGDLTYGIYLWQFPVIILIFNLLADVVYLPGLASQPWFLLLYGTITVTIAWLSFKFFEKPMRQKIRNATATRPSKANISAP